MGTPSLAYSACLYITSVREGVGARVVLVIFALLVTVQAGEAIAHEHPDRFSLYTGCDSMELHVDVDIENSSLSLSAEAVRSAAEARLRSARLYRAGDGDSRTLPGPFFCRDRVPATGAGLPAAGSTAAPRGPAWHSDTKCSPKWAAEHAPVTPLPDNGIALRTLPNQYLFVAVSGSSVAFSIRLQFYRLLTWLGPSKLTDWWRQEYPDGSEPVGYASTWKRVAVGTHDGTSTVVLSVVSQFMDAFLVDYLRMNEEDC